MPPDSPANPELYERLCAEFAAECELPEGTWVARVHHAMLDSLARLEPHRDALVTLLPTLIADKERGLFSAHAASSRAHVQQVFIEAVAGSTHPPADPQALGRLFTLLQFGVLQWWLLDRSEGQATTRELVVLLSSLGPAVSAALWLPGVSAILHRLDGLVREGLYG